VQAFLARPQRRRIRERARARQALIGHRQGRGAEAESTWTGWRRVEQRPGGAGRHRARLATPRPSAPRCARVGQATEAGDGRATSGSTLRSAATISEEDYARAIATWRPARQSNKNKMRPTTRKCSPVWPRPTIGSRSFRGPRDFLEMSQEFPVVRQIQEAVQGVYSMSSQRGHVEILWGGSYEVDREYAVLT